MRDLVVALSFSVYTTSLRSNKMIDTYIARAIIL